VIVSKIWMYYSPTDHQIYKQVDTDKILIFHLGKIESIQDHYVSDGNFPCLELCFLLEIFVHSYTSYKILSACKEFLWEYICVAEVLFSSVKLFVF
jgi:hypothetical protein